MDTEAQIAERLKENLPKPQPDTTTDRIDDANPQDQTYTSDIGDVPQVYKLYDFFGIETNFRNSENERKISEVYRWAADKLQSSDYLAVVELITRLEQAMGGNTLGSRLERIHQYIKLDQQINRLKKEQGWL